MTRLSDFILTLGDAAAGLAQVGGKGASLARLAAAGLPVPPGFHITTAAYRRFVTANNMQPQILDAVASVAPDRPATLDAAASRIGELFAQHAMPEEVAAAIRQAYAELGGGDLPVAIRSSATAEDLPGMSFAGQQETYLNVHGETRVLAAVQRCWASLWTARAIGYRARQGIAPAEVSLAVVVQELVPADAAGVLFTANPITGARDQALINAAWGLGEAIVGGQVTPDTLVVDKASGAIVEQEVGIKDVMTVRTPDGTREEPTPPDRRTRAVLDPAQVTALVRLGLQIETLYACPMDIEWALAAGDIAILQARPITALPPPPTAAPGAPETAWPVPNPRGSYMRASVLELLPDPLSPLFATLGLPAYGKTLADLIQRMGMTWPGAVFVTINGYGYLDLSLTTAQTVRMLLAVPAMFPLLRTARPRWEAARARYAARASEWQARDLTATPATALLDGARDLMAEAAQYYLSVQSGILPMSYLGEAFFVFAYRFLKRRSAPPALTFVLGYDSTPIQAEESLYDLAQWVREQTELCAALTGMTSAQFGQAYRQQDGAGAWPEFWRRLAAHQARFGHAIYNLDFAQAVPADDPVPILETVKFFAGGQAASPYARQTSARAAREQATGELMARPHNLRARLLRPLVRLAQDFAPLREDALADTGLGWPVLRRMLREIGQRLANAHGVAAADDVFWLELDELHAAAAALNAGQAPADHTAVVAARRAAWERARALTPPAALPLKSGARLLEIDFSRTLPARTDQAAGQVIKGVGASPGRVTGTARVIHGPEEFGQMQPGDILVARITTPAWTPLFALAAGVVTDVGGPLSHSSIVAREYHIPAVLGTGIATERLASGQRITVDGDTGQVSSPN
ncbi:MAG: PEP/pyruvate-binding domain-containing protein [Anaerolineae bacterium]